MSHLLRLRRAVFVSLIVSLMVIPFQSAAGAQSDGTPSTTPSLVDQPLVDPAVQQAQQRLDQTRAQQATIATRLDALAEDYEAARGHAERLAAELEGSDDLVADAEAAAQAAQQAQADQIRAAYMSPGLDLVRVSSAFLLAPDAGTALHGSAVMQRVAAGRADATDAIINAGQQVVNDVSTHRGVAGGTAAAMADVDDLAQAFTAELELATDEVAAAEASLAAAQAAQQQAAEAAQQAANTAAAAAAAQQSTQTGTTLVNVAGAGAGTVRTVTLNGGQLTMACPLGQPNGFIDSWGFPRSGGRSHQGTDMFAAHGTPIYAAADGTIGRISQGGLGGLAVRLTDAYGNRYYYAHLASTFVVENQQVRAGELIATNGNSGNARTTPPHLHWQFHPGGGAPVNPYPLAAALCR